ncbi:MAG: ribonuclease III [Pseudomonadota bacterium]
MSDQRKLTRAIGHEFADSELLTAALTHRSAGGRNNERLEFLGDAVLGLVIAEALYRVRDKAREGELSRLRASLVKRDTLADVARELSIGDYLHLGVGEHRSGGFRRSSILADALEALLGAIYLDGGFEAARGCVLRLFESRLADLPEAAQKDAKTRLQELLQARGLALPRYELIATEGQAHAQRFTASCAVDDLSLLSRGEGTSRQLAEQHAAALMLEGLASAGEPEDE